jgi:hypothetical protein
VKRVLQLSLALFALCMLALLAAQPMSVSGAGTTYYVSSSGGSDSNNGLFTSTPFKTIARVNGLALQPGDQVLFDCGDIWRAEMLRITASGSPGSPITFSSYPTTNCANQPILSGAQPITDWSLYSGNVYVADLSAGANAVNFPPATTAGINQLFRNGQRLGIGRWPNLNTPDGGYATIASQPSGTQITINGLPAGSWTGATVHVRAIAYAILNRDVTGSSGSTLTLNSGISCWGGSCADSGVWVDNDFKTLDQDGEWYYDHNANKVYLYSSGGNPNTAVMEGSAVLKAEASYLGGVILGTHLQQSVAHIVVENLEIRDWFDNGVTTPLNLLNDDSLDVIIRNNVIRDVDGGGINLQSWLYWAAQSGNGYNGWRGGRSLQVVGNTIDGANHFGIASFARQSLIEGNLVRNIALIKNLGQSGMGCGTTGSEGTCIEDGDGIQSKADQDGTYSGNNVTVRYNRVEQVGYNGIFTTGYGNLFDSNVILQPCRSKSDCSGLRGYGANSIAATSTHDVTVTNSIVVDAMANTDGIAPSHRVPSGQGIQFEMFCRNITVSNNTVIRSVFDGIRYQDSTGVIQNNTLYDNSTGSLWGNEVTIIRPPSHVASFTGNIMVGLRSVGGTLAVDDAGQLTVSDYNQFYHASRAAHIWAQGLKTLAQWRTYSGKDAHSTEMISATLATSEIFYDDTQAPKTFTLTKSYVDLNGSPVVGSLTLQPFTSKILIPASAPPTPPPPPGSNKLFLPLLLK